MKNFVLLLFLVLFSGCLSDNPIGGDSGILDIPVTTTIFTTQTTIISSTSTTIMFGEEFGRDDGLDNWDGITSSIGGSIPESPANLTATDTGLNGRIVITWNEMPDDVYGNDIYFIFRKKGGKKDYSIIDTVHGNIFEDRGLENDVDYYYKAVLGDTSGTIPEVTSSDETSVTVRPSKSKDISNEELIFVIPKSFTDNNPDYRIQVQEIIDGVNSIYKKNTKKSFTVKDVRIYDESDYCDESKASRCLRAYNDNEFYSPGVISIFYIDGNSMASFINSPALAVKIGFLSEKNQKLLYNDFDTGVFLLTHELGHSFGLGVPELYTYAFKQDKTNVDPILKNNTFIPYAYHLDPMQTSATYDVLEFGPLSAYLINDNLDHSKRTSYTGSKGFPKIIRIKINDINNNPVEGASIKIFCISNSGQLTETKPRLSIITDEHGDAILQKLEFDETDNPTYILNKGVFDDSCEINLIKIYSNGKNKVFSVTSLQLQEERIIKDTEDHILKVAI